MIEEGLYYDTGEIKYKGPVKDEMPWGWGCRYFKSGRIHMRGIFQDWFIIWGWEYYQNGNLRYVGHYNEGPRHYYGPRYFTQGELFYETGELWFRGIFNSCSHGNLGYPLFKTPKAFNTGTEYAKSGEVLKGYLNHRG